MSAAMMSHEEAEAEAAQDLDVLQSHGINAADIKKLKGAGIGTIKGFQMMTKRKLCLIKGMSEAKIDKIKEVMLKICGTQFKTAADVSVARQSIFHISTGCKAFDSILGGGVESQALTEVFGEFRTGKTQISHTLCVTCQIPTDTQEGGKAFYMDTEGTFRPDRLRQIAARFQLDENDVLENVLYTRCFTSEQQYEVLDAIAAKFNEEKGAFKLLIIDSVMALFRVDYSGRGELSERQQKLAQFLSRVQKIADEYNVAVFMTNQMTADPGATMSFQADPKKPIGGHILAHASTVRVQLKKKSGETRGAKIYDSPDLPEAEADYTIAQGGISDSGN